PKGETESALRQRLVAERPQSKRPVHAFIFAPERESIFDATGRMIRPEEMRKKREPLFNRDVLLSLADKYKPKPFGEEAIKKKLQERKVRLAAAEGSKQERKNTDSEFRGLKIEFENKDSKLSEHISTIPLNKAHVTNNGKLRQQILLNDSPVKFEIESNKNISEKKLREVFINTFVKDENLANKIVKTYKEDIEGFAKKHRVDPDLIKAVMWAENARGDKFGLNRAADSLGMSNSQGPMNINGEMWGALIGKKGKLDNPQDNIEAGVILLRRITDRVENPTASKIGSIWNFTGREKTNAFGEVIGKAYKEKPWEKKK
ncbi:MAG: hypothetical protein OEY94_06610, partial [Alphaproteobacteria bacterium]|nr:hypothetical protein [Alphaproteobacteria bacterium]